MFHTVREEKRNMKHSIMCMDRNKKSSLNGAHFDGYIKVYDCGEGAVTVFCILLLM